jgi:hypothetical protein
MDHAQHLNPEAAGVATPIISGPRLDRMRALAVVLIGAALFAPFLPNLSSGGGQTPSVQHGAAVVLSYDVDGPALQTQFRSTNLVDVQLPFLGFVQVSAQEDDIWAEGPPVWYDVPAGGSHADAIAIPETDIPIYGMVVGFPGEADLLLTEHGMVGTIRTSDHEFDLTTRWTGSVPSTQIVRGSVTGSDPSPAVWPPLPMLHPPGEAPMENETG